MNFVIKACVTGIAYFVFSGCDVPQEIERSEEKICEVTSSAAFLTYNTGLGWDMVPMPGVRAPEVAQALANASFDVACVQEAWHDEFRDGILDAVSLPPERTFVADTVDHGETGEDRCTTEDLEALSNCADAKCSSIVEPRETGMCVRKECGAEVAALFIAKKEPCLRCLGAMAGHITRETADVCTSEGASRIHGGRNGMMLLSRGSRLWHKEVLQLPASSANKVALLATVKIPAMRGGGEVSVEVACTHISANNPIAPSHSGFATWEEEKKAQIEAIMARLAERSVLRGGAPMVLMGDLNTGPDGGRLGFTASAPDVWASVEAAGYVSPAATPGTGTSCSSCADNTLGDGKGNTLLDHVAFRNAEDGNAALRATCSDRQFTKTINTAGTDEKEKRVNLSDHYGIRIMFDATRR